jgi:hypothetical protein
MEMGMGLAWEITHLSCTNRMNPPTSSTDYKRGIEETAMEWIERKWMVLLHLGDGKKRMEQRGHQRERAERL